MQGRTRHTTRGRQVCPKSTFTPVLTEQLGNDQDMSAAGPGEGGNFCCRISCMAGWVGAGASCYRDGGGLGMGVVLSILKMQNECM